MKQLIALVAFIMVSQAYAQDAQYVQPSQGASGLPQQAPKKRAILYDEKTNQLVEVSPQVESQPAALTPPTQPQPIVQTIPSSQTVAQAAPQQSANGSNPIVILNNQRVQSGQSSNQAQELPIVTIEDSPLKASQADSMRKKRQQTEAGTEDGIVQALEKARMDDEIKRRERFNQAIGGSPAPEVVAQPQAPQYPAYQPPAPPPVVQQPAPIIQQINPTPVVIQPVIEHDNNTVVTNEIREPLKDEEPKHKDQQYFVGAQVGTADYSAQNIRGNLSTGVSVGLISHDNMVFEGNFMYSKFQMDDVVNYGNQIDMNQYNVGATFKYSFLPGRIRPMIGIAGTYTRRNYIDDYYSTEFRTSNAFDLGPVAALDVMVSDNFAIGLDVRYFFNVFNSVNDSNNNSYYGSGNIQPFGTTNPERISYYTASLVGKFMF